MKSIDKDLLVAIVLFIGLVCLWVWIRDPWLQRGADLLLGAVVMGLKTGMGIPDPKD